MYDELITQAEWDTLELAAEFEACLANVGHEIDDVVRRIAFCRNRGYGRHSEAVVALYNHWDTLLLQLVDLTFRVEALHDMVPDWR